MNMAGKLETYGFGKIVQIGLPISMKNALFKPIQLSLYPVTKDPNLSVLDANPTFSIALKYHNTKGRKHPIYVSLDQFKRTVIQEEFTELKTGEIYYFRIERDPGHPKLGNNWLVTVAKTYGEYFSYKAELITSGTFYIGRPRPVRGRPSREVLFFSVQLAGGQPRLRGTGMRMVNGGQQKQRVRPKAQRK